MTIWRIGVDELARSRFAVSALAETVASAVLLEGGDSVPGMRDWVRTHRPAYHHYVARDPFLAVLVPALLQPNWVADFISIPPVAADRTFHDELRRVRQTPPEAAQAHISAGMNGQLPPRLRRADITQRAADFLEWVWTSTLRPDWPRRRQIFEADIVARTQQLSTGGWAAALSRIRLGMRWLGGGQLEINAHDSPPLDLSDAELMFIPCSVSRGWVSWELPHRYSIIYPCSGALADIGTATPSTSLSRLLGPTRAMVITQLASPKSTSQLVATTGYGLGSVGGHLKALLDAGLVRRRRAGRSVLYYRTRIGDQLCAETRQP